MSRLKKTTLKGTRWTSKDWTALWCSIAPIGLWVKSAGKADYGDWEYGELLWKPKLVGPETHWPVAVWSRTDKLALPVTVATLRLWSWSRTDAGKVDRALSRTLVRWMDQKVASQNSLADWAWRLGESEPLRFRELAILEALKEAGPNVKWWPRVSYTTREKSMWLAKLLQAEAWVETWEEGG